MCSESSRVLGWKGRTVHHRRVGVVDRVGVARVEKLIGVIKGSPLPTHREVTGLGA